MNGCIQVVGASDRGVTEPAPALLALPVGDWNAAFENVSHARRVA